MGIMDSMTERSPIRLGLCCIFREVDITFRSRQAGHILKLPRVEQLDRLSTTVVENGEALLRALKYCAGAGIGSFRVNSGFLPLKSHPQAGYALDELPAGDRIMSLFTACRNFARAHDIRLTFHPDQFTLLSSPRPEVHHQSLAELDYHGELAELIGADVITLHGGGAYGDKTSALARLEASIGQLPEPVRSRLALENDDRVYSPAELLPVCERTGVGFVYDVHHHRCLADGMSVAEVSRRALATWDREPLFHLSSPRDSWQGRELRPHHDFIDPADFPSCWHGLRLTVEVEAKAKELAVARLRHWLDRPRKRGGMTAAATAGLSRLSP